VTRGSVELGRKGNGDKTMDGRMDSSRRQHPKGSPGARVANGTRVQSMGDTTHRFRGMNTCAVNNDRE